MDTGEFLRRVWPREGTYCLVFPSDKGFHHEWFDAIEEAAATALLADAQRSTVYFALASYVGRTSRKASLAQAVRALWLDLDVGTTPAKFTSKGDALKALQGFLAKTGLPTPLIVDSGGGFHCYWCFDADVEIGAAKKAADGLKALCTQENFKADPSRTADMASILRPVGTHNFKYGNSPPVEALNASSAVVLSFPTFSAMVAEKTNSLPSAPTTKKPKPTSTVNDDLLIPKTYEKSDVERTIAGCQQLGVWKRDASTISEPLWYAGLQTIHFCVDGDKAIHEISKAHPGYSPQQTDAKIRQIEDFGPASCTTFESRNPGGCNGCPHRGKITSPITLGVVAVELTTPPDDDDDGLTTQSDDAIGFVPPPKPYIRTTSGVKQVKDDGSHVNLCAYDIVLTDLAWDSHLGYEVASVKHYTPQDGWQRFRFRSSLVANIAEFEKVLRDNHVKPWKVNELRTYFIRYMEKLQDVRKLGTLYASMGWKDGTNEFVLGRKVFRKDGSVDAAGISDAAGKSLTGFGAKGELEPWVNATELFNTIGLEAHAFTASVWCGAPLMRFAGLPAALFSVVGKTNSGKSSMADFFLSAFGEYRKLSMREDDTGTVKDTRMGAFGSLPVYIDESTNKDPKTLSDFVYQITQGRSKARGRIDGSERPTMEWNTIVVSSANSSLSARLGVTKANPHAERVRLFEYHVEPHPGFNRATSKQLHDDVLSQHYGRSGEEYIKYVVTHQDEVREGLADAIKKLDKLSSATDEERYISTSVGCVLYGAGLAERLGLLKFDTQRMWPWAVEQIKGRRVDRDAEKSDEIELLGRYLNEFAQSRIIVDESKPGARSDLQVLQYPKGELHQRFEIGAGIMWIDRKHFRDWLVKSHENYEALRVNLLGQRVLLTIQKKTLAAGSGLGSAAVECLKINMRSAILNDLAVSLSNPMESRELGSDE